MKVSNRDILKLGDSQKKTLRLIVVYLRVFLLAFELQSDLLPTFYFQVMISFMIVSDVHPPDLVQDFCSQHQQYQCLADMILLKD